MESPGREVSPPKTRKDEESNVKWGKVASTFFGSKETMALKALGTKEALAVHFKRIAENESSVFDDHRLGSQNRHESEVEQLVYRIEERRCERISITADVGRRFVKCCRKIAKVKKYSENLNKIRLADLMQMQDMLKKENQLPSLCSKLGIRSQTKQLLVCLETAVEIVNRQSGAGGSDSSADWFYFEDFNIYYTQIESRWPWIRNGTVFSALSFLFFFFVFTPIFLCFIVQDDGTCPAGPTKDIINLLYFAAVTVSTVGYGDVHVDTTEFWSTLCGIIYMICCYVFLIVIFASAAESSNSTFDNFGKSILNWVWGNNKQEQMTKKIRRVTIFRLSQIILIFIILNLIGVLLAKCFTDFNFVQSLYWSVQTTTTIGYGDLNTDINNTFRTIMVFYVLLGTYFVGNTLGGLASLKDEVNDMKAFEAWNRREASKGLIDELQPYHRDDKIDQYEFFVASMVILGKVSYDDVVPVMDKYRSLAGAEGFIQVDAVENAGDIEQHSNCHLKCDNEEPVPVLEAEPLEVIEEENTASKANASETNWNLLLSQSLKIPKKKY